VYEDKPLKLTISITRLKLVASLEQGGLMLLSIFGRKKEKVVEQAKKSTELEQLLGGDKETYDALYPVLFLDPRKIEVSMKGAAENAKRSEKLEDFAAARMWYEIAGGLAVYEGKVKRVAEYYGKAEKITGQPYLILKNPEKAVAKAQEYYKKYLS
jgi:hypothetical protein